MPTVLDQAFSAIPRPIADILLKISQSPQYKNLLFGLETSSQFSPAGTFTIPNQVLSGRALGNAIQGVPRLKELSRAVGIKKIQPLTEEMSPSFLGFLTPQGDDVAVSLLKGIPKKKLTPESLGYIQTAKIARGYKSGVAKRTIAAVRPTENPAFVLAHEIGHQVQITRFGRSLPLSEKEADELGRLILERLNSGEEVQNLLRFLDTLK